MRLAAAHHHGPLHLKEVWSHFQTQARLQQVSGESLGAPCLQDLGAYGASSQPRPSWPRPKRWPGRPAAGLQRPWRRRDNQRRPPRASPKRPNRPPPRRHPWRLTRDPLPLTLPRNRTSLRSKRTSLGSQRSSLGSQRSSLLQEKWRGQVACRQRCRFRRRLLAAGPSSAILESPKTSTCAQHPRIGEHPTGSSCHAPRG